jgi:serine/threonine protein phosphatase PrpC
MALFWNSASQSHPGKRRNCNEDAVLSRPDVGLWVVADGMGGHQAGDVASQAIADALRTVPLSGDLSRDVDKIEDTLISVNDELRLHAQTQCQGGTVGSTVVTLLARDEIGVALWAGDSRLYRLRHGRLEQITRDHNPISDLLDSGTVSEAQALNADTNIITRAVGGQADLNLDVVIFDVRPDDTFLLCSDGLYRELEVTTLQQELHGEILDEVADALLQMCLEGPARDNVSLVLARQGVRYA